MSCSSSPSFYPASQSMVLIRISSFNAIYIFQLPIFFKLLSLFLCSFSAFTRPLYLIVSAPMTCGLLFCRYKSPQPQFCVIIIKRNAFTYKANAYRTAIVTSQQSTFADGYKSQNDALFDNVGAYTAIYTFTGNEDPAEHVPASC